MSAASSIIEHANVRLALETERFADLMAQDRAHKEAQARAAAAAQAREDAETRRQYQVRYADAFGAFGSLPPAPIEDERPGAYSKRLFEHLRCRLRSTHKLADVRAELSHQQRPEGQLRKHAVASRDCGRRPAITRKSAARRVDGYARPRRSGQWREANRILWPALVHSRFVDGAEEGCPDRQSANRRCPLRAAAAQCSARLEEAIMTRSPWSSSTSIRRQRGEPARSPWSTSRADGGHIAGHVGKAGASPASLRRDNAQAAIEERRLLRENEPVVGENQSVSDRRR